MGVLTQVSSAESGLRALGLSQLRVRHHGQLARIEVPLDDLEALLARREAAVAACTAAGYRWVTLDLEGFRWEPLRPLRRDPAMSAARVRLTFHADLVRAPVIARLARTFDVLPNIRRASVEETVGWIVCELDGPADQVEAAIAWLVEQGVEVDPLGDVVES